MVLLSSKAYPFARTTATLDDHYLPILVSGWGYVHQNVEQTKDVAKEPHCIQGYQQ